ncbi:endonuclease V [Amycolatopsis albispora]|uniref:endonuclease V n=1 Tax=Amycolatopsis albispora TaxID=1804986 RepID=UPI0026D78061
MTGLDLDTLAVVDQAVVEGEVDFPYVPGLFAFRELPPLLGALKSSAVTNRPDPSAARGRRCMTAVRWSAAHCSA